MKLSYWAALLWGLGGGTGAMPIRPDPKLPQPSVVEGQGSQWQVRGGTVLGANLFHRLIEFGVPAATTVTFEGAPNLDRIVVQVTGTQPSHIEGTLAAPVDLFLLNPQGLRFGPTARLNLGGSLLASTATSLQFAGPDRPLLAVGVPLGLQFGQEPGSLQVQTQGEGLRVPAGQSLVLIGGDVRLEAGRIAVPGGIVALGSVGENAWVSLPNGLPDYTQVHQFRDLTLRDRSLVQASGAQRGDIALQGGQVWLREGSIASVDALGESEGGTLTVTAQTLRLQDGSQLQTGTRGPGAGGNLVVQADTIAILGHRPNSRVVSGLLAVSTAEATGHGGEIAVTANRLTLADGGQIATTTFGRGDAGNLRIAVDALEIIGGIPGEDRIASGIKAATGLNAAGNGGRAIVTARQVQVRNGGEIQVSTLGSGAAGELRLTVGESLIVQGTSETGQFPSGVRAVSGLVGINEAVSGAGGNLVVQAPHLQITDGAIVQVSATGSGAAGNLRIEGDRLELRHGGALLGDTRAGAGNLQIATGLLILREHSRISTNAQGVAVGGNVDVQSNALVALENSDITANAEAARGGRISLQTTALLGTAFRDRPTPASDITATSELGPEFSGIVEIQTPEREPNPTVGAFPEQPLDIAPWLTSRCRQESRRNRFVWVGGGLPQASGFPPLADLGDPSPLPMSQRQSPTLPTPGCHQVPSGRTETSLQIRLLPQRPAPASPMDRRTTGK